MLKYAVIGTSWITQSFIDGAKLDNKMQLSAVYSRSEEKGREFALRNGVDRVFTSLEELAGSDVDAVYIASPNSFHATQSEIMLNAGKHVLCEKPITVTPDELVYLQNLAKKNTVIYAEAIMHMYNPARGLLAKAMERIGRITSAHFDFSQLSSKYPAYKNGELPNIFNPVFATGCLEDLGIYCVYPAVDYFGMPKEISALSYFLESGADGCGSAALRYDDKHVTLTYSKLGQNRLGSQIFGDAGTITIGSISQFTDINIVFNDGTSEKIIGDVPKERLMGNEASLFADIVADPDGYSDFYNELCDTALKTSRIMAEIRKHAGIRFDEYKEIK